MADGNFTNVVFQSSVITVYQQYTSEHLSQFSVSGDSGSTIEIRNASGDPAVGDVVELWDNAHFFSNVTYLGRVGDYPVIQVSGSVFYVLGIALTSSDDPLAVSATPFCFLSGVRIATATGEVPVEDLRPGDLVISRFGGLRPVEWVSVQRFRGEFLGVANAPVRIKAGALGDNQPARDLLVSPEHSVLIGDVLVMAKLLVNDVTIVQEAMAGEIAYHHVDLGAHDVILADGAWAESYYECYNRQNAQNYAEYLALHPGHDSTRWATCLPIVDSREDARLGEIRQTILDRIPAEALAADPDIHLDVDGVRVEPLGDEKGGWRFEIPAGARNVRLRSRAGRPSGLLPPSSDDRRLGMALTRLTLATRDADILLRLDGPGLGEGLWPPEREAGAVVRRWTRGDAVIPVDRLAGETEPVTLIVEGAALHAYLARASGDEAGDLAPTSAVATVAA